MAKYDELRNYEVVKTWLRRIRKKPKTEKNYLMGLQKYVDFTGLTPDEIISEANDEVKLDIPVGDRAVLTRREEFIEHLEGLNASSSVILNSLNAINSFYRSHYIKDFPDLVTKISPQPKKENTGFITKDDIGELLDIADPLEKAVILTGATSGLSMIDICNLKVRNFKEGYDSETGITAIPWTRIKTPSKVPVNFITFLTPEASDAVFAYIKFRNRPSAPRQHITSDENYLFIPRKISGEYDPANPETEERRKFTEVGFTRMYARLAENSKKVNPNDWNVVRSHQMRKFFSQLSCNRIQDATISLWTDSWVTNQPALTSERLSPTN